MKSKKALSEIVGYVLLIVIAVGISILVYSFLKGYIIKEDPKCPDNLAISIYDYTCHTEGGQKLIDIQLANAGTYNINGYMLRLRVVYIDEDGNEKTSILKRIDGKDYDSILETRQVLGVGNMTAPIQIDYTGRGDVDYTRLINIEVEPYISGKNYQKVLCSNAVISQPIEDCV